MIAPRPVASAIARATPWVPAAKAGTSQIPSGPFHSTVRAPRIRAAKSATVRGPMSTPISSGPMASSSRAALGALPSGAVETTQSTGSTSSTPRAAAWSSTVFATSTLSGSTRERPVALSWARRKVNIMAPPISRPLTRVSSAVMTSILPEILAPPSTATNGRAGCSSARPR